MRPPPTINPDSSTPTEFPKRWLDESAACRLVGRTKRTLDRWRCTGSVRARKVNGKLQYESGELLAAKVDSLRRMNAAGFAPGCVAGPGRPRHPARPRIIQLLARGWDMHAIATDVECSTGLVRQVQKEQDLQRITEVVQ